MLFGALQSRGAFFASGVEQMGESLACAGEIVLSVRCCPRLVRRGGSMLVFALRARRGLALKTLARKPESKNIYSVLYGL